MAQFSSVQEEGPRFLPLQMTREGGESLGHLLVKPHHGLFFWKIHFGGTQSPSLVTEQIYSPIGGHLPGDFMVACKWESQQ